MFCYALFFHNGGLSTDEKEKINVDNDKLIRIITWQFRAFGTNASSAVFDDGEVAEDEEGIIGIWSHVGCRRRRQSVGLGRQ
ncbi:hypothetical protein PCCS19_10710 [Paenibacillus sp. CCS19]|nr:hypothetical protein PCCS19_10710 [Paenibacillus cellulosilyticus]